MQINRGTDYAIRAILYLTQHQQEAPVLLNQIADAIGAPTNYLSNLFQTLSRFNLVTAHRGSRRGYSLARPPAEISLLNIVEALEGPLDIVCCMNDPEACPLSADCVVSAVFMNLRQEMRKKLGAATMAKLHRQGQKI